MNLLDRMIGEADVCKNKVNKADKEFHNPPFTITKADEDKRLVFGWALVSADKDGNKLIDHQGDMVDPDDLEEGAYEYVLNFRDAGEEHIGTLRKKARMVESCVFTPEKMKAIGIPEGTIPVGWWIGFYVDDDTTWERIKSGKYKMFSIEGKAVREPVTKNAFDEWLEDHLDADEETQRNMKEKLDRPRTVAKTFSEIVEKFNPYHDRLGRFTSGGSATSFTIRTKDPSKQHMADNAIAREKERSSSGVKTGNYTETKPQQKPQKESNTADTPQKKSLHTVEDKIRHQFYESAAVVDKDGNVLFKKDGAQSQVGFTNKEVKMMDGNSLTHNHPSSSVFSTEDITMLVKSGLSEIRATTREGITYSARKGTGYDSAKGMRFLVNYDGERKSAMRHAQATLDGRGYYGKIMDGKITQEQANHDFGKVMSSQMVRWCNTQSKKYGVDFEVERREVPKKDKVNIGYASKSFNDDDKFVLDRDSEKEMQDAFNEWLSNHKEKTAKSFNDFLKERR